MEKKTTKLKENLSKSLTAILGQNDKKFDKTLDNFKIKHLIILK
jgi:hypothetical protein